VWMAHTCQVGSASSRQDHRTTWMDFDAEAEQVQLADKSLLQHQQISLYYYH